MRRGVRRGGPVRRRPLRGRPRRLRRRHPEGQAALVGVIADVAFVSADFFTWAPPEPLHLIFDYTFFCALDPSLRPAWAAMMDELLRPDGELITLMYLPQDQDSGPPYNTTVLDYEEVLTPLGFFIESIQDNDVAVEPRKGLEKIARWKKMPAGAETKIQDLPPP